MSCGNDLLTRGNDLVYCCNDLLTHGNDLVYCCNDLLTHVNKIKKIIKRSYVPSWPSYETEHLYDTTNNWINDASVDRCKMYPLKK